MGDGDSRNSCYLKQNKERDLIYIRLASKVRMFLALHQFFAKWRTCKKKVQFLTEKMSSKLFIKKKLQ